MYPASNTMSTRAPSQGVKRTEHKAHNSPSSSAESVKLYHLSPTVLNKVSHLEAFGFESRDNEVIKTAKIEIGTICTLQNHEIA